jgi:hypothetical protein
MPVSRLSICLLIPVFILGCGPSSNSNDSKPTNNSASPAVKQSIDEARRTARRNYVIKMQQEFDAEGIDATISDFEDDVVVVSDQLKTKANRDKLMRVFDPAYRRALCSAGFKGLKLKSGYVFGEGESYSLGCRDTDNERSTRLQAEQSQRQEFVDNLQGGLQRSGIDDIRVALSGHKLVLTGSSAKDVPPRALRALIQQVADEDRAKLCSIGFSSVQARSNISSTGIIVPLSCKNTTR